MKSTPKEGISHTAGIIVTDEISALKMGSGNLEVLATPAMVALMENAAMNAVKPFLEEGESTVGAFISTTHEHPTHIGETVSATATLTEIEGRKLTFTVEASDSKGIIGRGTHIRYVISVERFMK